MIVQSLGALRSITTPTVNWSPSGGGSVSLYGERMAYARIFASQPNVRTCVEFLARNCAQLGIHAFRRNSDTDRERLNDHDVVRWLGRPNPATRRYRMIEALVSDLGIYFESFWIKLRADAPIDGRKSINLVRLPPEELTIDGGLLPSGFVWTRNGRRIPLALDDVIRLSGYNPCDPLRGLSPLDTLRRILAEEAAAGAHRESYWLNAGRMEGVVEIASTAPNWSKEQKQEFRDDMDEFRAGGGKVGRAMVLPKGMTFKQGSWSPRDSEFVAARKLTREECASAYHIPLPLVGILEHATFSNIVEQHKHLYADCLGPTLEMITQEFEAQLLVESEDTRDVYLEFNIAEKLKGSFEEQAASLQALVGRPLMTANEGRARINLPHHEGDGADELGEQQGVNPPLARQASRQVEQAEAQRLAQLGRVVRESWGRQASRIARLPAGQRARGLDTMRCINELRADLEPLLGVVGAAEYAQRNTAETYARLRAGDDPFPADREVEAP